MHVQGGMEADKDIKMYLTVKTSNIQLNNSGSGFFELICAGHLKVRKLKLMPL